MRTTLARLAFAVALWVGARAALAQDRFIEDIQVSRTGNEATILVHLGCPMRYVSDAADDSGALLEIRLAPLDACRALGLGNGIASELYRPPSGQMARLTEVEYESLGLGDNLLMLRFEAPPKYQVTQHGDLRTLELTVSLEQGGGAVASAAQPPTTTPQPSALPRPRRGVPPSATPAPATAAPASSERAPLNMRTVEPETPRDFVINLSSTREPVDQDAVAGILPGGKTLYISDIDLGSAVWHRLRLGFFDSEEAAREMLATLTARFPKAWVGRAEPAEIAAAEGHPLAIAAAAPSTSGAGTPEPIAATPAATQALEPGTEAAAADRAAELMKDARAAMLAANYPEAIRLYTEALQIPGEHGAEAREFLGLARERNHQTAYARAEYQAYLKEYPDGEGTARVRQRLAGLAASAAEPRAPLRTAEAARQSTWDFFSGISQYYRRDVSLPGDGTDPLITQSALLSDFDLNLRRRGSSIDVLGRVTATHIYDLMPEETFSSRGSDTRVSYAYVDVDDHRRRWSTRFGRQTLHTGGVLGRFDGLYSTYEWAPDRELHFTAGYPVESTRNGVQTDRQFYGLSADFNNVWRNLDLTAFVNRQSIGPLLDRQAAGGEARYSDDHRSLVALVDYDTSYSEVAAAMLLGSWRLDNRMTFSLLLNQRRSPYLTTRNALIGQQVSDIEELLLLYNEDEIRALALDRTATTRTTTFGFSSPFAQRFQVNADLTTTETDATQASGNVAAIPGTGPQSYYTINFVGSGLFKVGDVTVFGYRRSDSDSYTSDLVTFDMRLPVGRVLRINPRVRVLRRENLLDFSTQTTVAPSFRLLLNAKRRYRLEFEVGRDWTRRDLATGDLLDDGAYFYNLGYRVDF